jgi:bisphosphoglycerate-dependent phosphoglycerate mutase
MVITGKRQADLTGRRLAELALPYSVLVRSTMTRAIETAEIIAKHLPPDLPGETCALLHEGAPIPPEPPVGHWRPEQHVSTTYCNDLRVELSSWLVPAAVLRGWCEN